MDPRFHSQFVGGAADGDGLGASWASTYVGHRHTRQLLEAVEVGAGRRRQLGQPGASAYVVRPPREVLIDGNGAVDVALVVGHLRAALAVDLVLRADADRV